MSLLLSVDSLSKLLLSNGLVLSSTNPQDGSATLSLNYVSIDALAGSGFIDLPSQSSDPATPAASHLRIFNNANNKFAWIGASGYVRNFDGTLTASRTYLLQDRSGTVAQGFTNYSTALQTPAATTRTYITGSNVVVPSGGLQIGTVLRWKFNMTKTGAGSASSTIDIAFGTAGTTADTARVSFTKPAGTAAADEAWCEVTCVIRGPLSGSGIAVGEFTMIHNLASTGHATIPCVAVNTVSSAFDVTVSAVTSVGLCITTGASDAITIQQVSAEAINL